MDVLQYIKKQYSHFNLTEHELSTLGKHITVTHYKRNDFFLREDNASLKMGLLISGTAYSYKMNDNGEEVVDSFFYPDQQEILFDYKSYFKGTSSNLNIKFQEEAVVSFFYIQDIKTLYDDFPRFLQFELLIIQQEFLYAIHRNEILHANTAEEKIKLLQEQMPKVFELFPYVQIASYLGIHRNTFRRVFSKH
ncbi:Crp/Fnr family transcriptional regulator [Owenweeksia hongkongensis]|uniref:cAMP-binding protein n=1 Tax=Owenweeksia hongkongensis (strain DSM 17368 / CIP 108786 / JCM 12287 / NRRL B-23963 / UST20020801) TaxID=926562 RepID=G8R7T0_OWEHD|nr:Crp/Fnr family transcriptional regulator [Owenweeksia hongkongensis]AEV33461.1 hypothetical protein Oweho_2491 [Owenweeksia hongkongensis DSM 17368]